MGKEKVESVEAEGTAPASTSATRERKLTRDINGTVVTFKEVSTGKEVSYDFASLPASIQAKLGPYGLNQKLGDAAAGKTGYEALEAIAKTFEALAAENWSFRTPAAPKISIQNVKDQLANMTEAERAAAAKMLAGLGINL